MEVSETPSVLLAQDQQLSPCCEWGERKGKGHTVPSAPCAKSSGSPAPGLGLLISPDDAPAHYGFLHSAAGDLHWSVSLLGKKWECLHEKSCSFLNNAAPILGCILNLAGRWLQGSCCPCTRSWCQLGPWHWGLEAPPWPWDMPCQGKRWHNFGNLLLTSIPQVVTGSLTNICHCGLTNKPSLTFKEDWKSDSGSLVCSQPLLSFQKEDSGSIWQIFYLQ